MKGDYSNRELDLMFKEIMTVLTDIKEQTTKTNGRVLKLEDEVKGIQLWKASLMAKIGGVFATISVVWVIIKEFVLK
jgi:hypothetical protein